MFRPHENDENDVSFSMKMQTSFRKRSPEWKDLKAQQYRCRVDGSKLMKTQTFEDAHSGAEEEKWNKNNGNFCSGIIE